MEDDRILVRRLPAQRADVRASRAGRTGRSWYGSYAVSYADPSADEGVRWVGGHTNKQRALASARQYVEQGAAWAEVRQGDRDGEVIDRFPRELRPKKTASQLDREIAAAIGRRGVLTGIGNIAGRAIAYVRWVDGSTSDYTLTEFRRTFGVPARDVPPGGGIVEIARSRAI